MGQVEGQEELEAAIAAEIAAADGVERTQARDDQDSELLDLERVRPRIEAMVERDALGEARGVLEQIARFPDTTRRVEDNVWLYRTLGDVRREVGEREGALEAYRSGFGFDPRALELLRPYGAMLEEREASEEALKVFRALLLYHKRALGSAELVGLYCQMGACYERTDRAEKARTSFEKALEIDPGNESALTGLLRVVAASGEPREVLRVRAQLIRNLRDPLARSMALIALGDDYDLKFNDPARAIDAYEQALIEHATNRRALERIVGIARQTEDWRQLSRALVTMSRLADEPAEQAEFLIQASLVSRDRLWEPEKALAGLERAVELDPSRLDAFKAITSILVDRKEWKGLKRAYVRLLTALDRQETRGDAALRAVLWTNLAELYRTHLEDKHEAIVAFEQASHWAPRDASVRRQIVELTETDPEHLERALEHMHALYALDRDDFSLLDRMGRVYLRRREVDRAYCVYRVLVYRGAPLDEKARAFVEQYHSPLYRPPKNPLTLERIRHYLFHPSLDDRISAIFQRIKEPLAENWVCQDRSKYGLRRKDRLKLDQNPTFFHQIYQGIGKLLTYPTLPEIWRKSDQEGLINGALRPDGLIVGDALLGSGREKEIAFVVAKQLFLFLPRFYLAAVTPDSAPGFYQIAAALALGQKSGALSGDAAKIHQILERGLDAQATARIKQAVGQIGPKADVAAWLEAVEASANRAGFVFCDDLNTCEEYLRIEPQSPSSRSVAERMNDLVDYSLSDEYAELRSILGLSIG